jgi:5-methylthioadenosine/S-adenosylhomocysteine deaminase
MNTSTKKQAVDTLIHARYIIPIIPKGLVLTNHSIAFLDEKIVSILPTTNVEDYYTAKQEFQLSQHALMPGLINAHGHAAMSLFRGLADDLPLMEWLNDHIWPAEASWVSEEFVRDGTELAIAEMIRGGTSCFSDMYFFPNVAAQVADKIGIRAQFCCPILDFPTVWGSGPEDYIAKALDLNQQYEQNKLISIGLGPHAPYTVSDQPLETIRDIAIEKKLPIQIHLHETQHEVDDAIKQSGIRPIQRLKDIGLISQDIPLQCVHMTALSEEDIRIIKQSATSVVHCPESNLKLASGFCEVSKLLDAGINVTLGTDGAASNNDLDMFGELRTAALIAKPIANSAAALDAATALDMATINGAKALGIETLTGSLEVGKCADLIAINLDQLNSQPSFDPISDIVYSVASNQVSHHWINGQLLLQDGKLLNLDVKEIILKAQHWASKIKVNTK